MIELEKNRVYDTQKIETLKSSAETLLDTGINCAKAWDESIKTLQSLLAESPVVSLSLSSALDGAGTLYQEEWDTEKEWIGNALTNITTNIPAYDTQAAGVLDPLVENLTLIKGMTEDLSGCIESAGTELALSEFHEQLQAVKQEWDSKSLTENLQEFGTSLIGLVENTCYGADPVNMSTGNFLYRYTDLKCGGSGAPAFIRSYNAMSRHKGILGRGWSHNWEKHLEIKEGVITLYNADGRQEKPAGLIKNKEGGYLIESPERGVLEHYDETGRLVLVKEKGNKITHVTYEGERLSKVYQKTGEELRFSYDAAGHLIKVGDHTGREIRFLYEGKKLVSVTDPEGRSFSYEYGENGKISRIRDKRNTAVVENGYDDYNRVVHQRFPDGGEITLSYEDAKRAVTLTEQNGNRITYVHDSKFRSRKTVYEDGYEETAYDKDGHVIKRRDKNAGEERYVYDKEGNLTESIDKGGAKTERVYDQNGRLLEVKDPAGNITSYAYDGAGRCKSITNPMGEGILFTYREGEGKPEKVQLADGSCMYLSYDEKGNITGILYPDGSEMHYAYDMLGRVRECVDGNGSKMLAEYDAMDRIRKIIRADGKEETFAYNEMGEALAITDFDGYVSRWEYNGINKPCLYEDKQGRKTFMEYDRMWNLSKVTDPEGGTTEYEYDHLKRLIKVTDPLSRSVGFSYDAEGNRTKVTYPDGTCLAYEYDACNRVIKERDRAGRETQKEYDSRGNLTCITDPEGNKRYFLYDACNRKIEETDRNGAVTAYAYTALGKIRHILHPDNRKETYTYLPGGRLEKHDKGDGTWEKYAYDKNGNLTEKTNQDNRTYRYLYDCLNRVKSISLNGEIEKTYEYDAMGNVTCMGDQAGRRIKYCYSPMGNLLCITDAAGNRVHYSYNKRDELTGILQMEKGKEAVFFPELSEADGNRALCDKDWEFIKKHNEENQDLHLTIFDRDKAGQIIKVTDALNGEDHYTYDCMGRIIKRLDQNGEETLFTYHADGELKSIAYPDGSTALHRTAEYQYDALKRLNRIKDWLGESTFNYDKEGNLTESSMLLTGEKEKQTIVYEYTLSGKRKSITYPDGSRSEYAYDDKGRIESIRNGAFSLTYEYGTSSDPYACHRNNGTSTFFAYDDNGRIKELTHKDKEGILEKFRCEYDSSGNRAYIKRESRDPAFSFDRRYEYDPLDRLINIKEDGILCASFTYEGYGNRIREKRYLNGEIISEKECAYNALNQLTQDGEKRYLYDKKGNQSHAIPYEDTDADRRETKEDPITFGKTGHSKAEHTMRYDPNNNFLTELYETGNLIQQNEYNGAGIRVRSRDIYGESVYGTDYADPLHKIITEAKGKSTLTGFATQESDRDIQTLRYRNYLWQDNTLLGIPQEGLHVLTDLSHSPIRITDREGNTKNLYQYDEYGIMENQKESVSMPFGYAGYVKENIPGLYYTGSRAYTVKEGRFLSKDLYRYLDVKDPLSINLYAYVKNNPLRYLDPDGHTCIEEKSYLARSIETVVLGDFSDEVTGLGVGASVLLSLAGWDVFFDGRDLIANLANFAPKDLSWWGNVALNLVALIPLIGVLKPIIKGFKHLDEVAGVVKYSDEVADSAKYLDEAVEMGSKTISQLLKETTCSKDELYVYLSKQVGLDAAEVFAKNGTWPRDVQIPKNPSTLNPDGSINWSKAPQGGYTLDNAGNAIKEKFMPEIGEVIDRYGPANGRYTSPVIEGKPFSYSERSLPYVEDTSKYHQYEITGDFTKIEEYVKNCTNSELKSQIDAAVTAYYDGDYSKLVSYKGTVAEVEGWGQGGATQYEFSLTIEQLEGLGLLKVIK